jgi:P27 family predicted phage terminase small subunit
MGRAGPRKRSQKAAALRGARTTAPTKPAKRRSKAKPSSRTKTPPAKPEPAAAIAAGDQPPEWLGEIGCGKWAELFGPLQRRLGLQKELDRDVLALYCDSWQQKHDADETLRREGETFQTEKGYVGVHPCVQKRRRAIDLIRRLGIELGLTPSSRRGLDLATGEDDPLEAFLRR